MEISENNKKKKMYNIPRFYFHFNKIQYATTSEPLLNEPSISFCCSRNVLFFFFFFLHGEEKKSDVDDMDGPLNVVVFRQLKISVPISRAFFSPVFSHRTQIFLQLKSNPPLKIKTFSFRLCVCVLCVPSYI